MTDNPDRYITWERGRPRLIMRVNGQIYRKRFQTIEEARAERDRIEAGGGVNQVESTAPTDEAEDVDQREARKWISDQRYVYNPQTDTYVTFLKAAREFIAISGDAHRAMKRAYSDWDGQPASVNQICRQFSMPRAWFKEYKEIHGWTHDSEPFSAEEMLERDIDDLVDDALQQRRRVLFQRYEVRKWQETKIDADKWRAFEQSTLLVWQEFVREHAPSYRVPKLTLPNVYPARHAVILGSLVDLHDGKYGWSLETGQGYNRQIAEQRLLKTTEELLARVLRFGRPELIIIPIGGDDEHVDNYQGTTTSGTPQDTDGTPAQIAIEHGWLLIKFFDMVRQAGVPIRAVLTPGNHNRHTSIVRAQMLYAWYRNDDDVMVDITTAARTYITHGDALIGLTHGDGVKHKDLGGIMATEAAREWGQARHRAWFVQHLHHEKMIELAGVKVYQMPSLSGGDRWHNQHGYTTATPGAAAYLIDRRDGVCATVFAPAE